MIIRKKLENYFSERIEREKIPPFETIRFLLEERDPGVGSEPRFVLLFYALTLILAACIITAGITFRSPLTGYVTSGFRESDFGRHAKEKFRRAALYLSHLEKFNKGDK